MLMQKDKSCLLLIDVQEKLAPHVMHSEALIERCNWLMRLATELGVSLLVSEQYPRGLGHTVEPLLKFVLTDNCIHKVHFSSYREPSFIKHWQGLNKQHVVIAGMETHVCVLQTALDMKAAGLEVFVVVDAVSSRHEIDHKYGLKRMKQEGIHLVTAEMVFFEWIEHSDMPGFKALSQSFMR